MQVALITGATGGLGEHLALGLDNIGYRVIIHFFQSKNKAVKLQKKLKNNPILIKGDIRKFKDVKEMASVVEKKIGGLNILINNASITKDTLLIKYPESDWDNVIKTNLKGAFNSIKSFVPLMIKSGGGHIINISSYSGLKGKEGQAAYSASKAALHGLTTTSAKELSEYNIRMNSIIPGYLPLGMGLKSPDAIERAKRDNITGALSDPDDVVNFIKYLVKTRNITGQIFSLESRL